MGRKKNLPDDALVVRCGQPPFDVPRPLRQRCENHEGNFGFSVQSAANVALDELAAWCSNNNIGLTTVGAIRSAGYDVVSTSGRGFHATVVVPRQWNEQAAHALIDLFETMVNPVVKGMRLR